MNDQEKYRGCLIGGAAGDALGYPVESCDEEDIFRKYGEGGITGYDGAARISGITQMTMFTANALLVNMNRICTTGAAGKWESMAASLYYDWYRTQTEEYPVDLDQPYSWSWLLNVPEMFSRRSPDAVCFKEAAGMHDGDPGKADNESKGCGGLVRVAPVGLYFKETRGIESMIDDIGAKIAGLTHGHELGYIPAAAFTHIIMMISHRGYSIVDAVLSSVDVIQEMFPESIYAPILCRLLNSAVELAKKGVDDLDAIHSLGKGRTAEEALAIAVYCSVKYQEDFEKAIIAAVNHGGSSVSTGAITGNIVGTHVGLKGIPDRFRQNLELYEVVLELADDLYEDCKLKGQPGYKEEKWESKYTERKYARKEYI